jgi:uncharacterized lipoprotein YajG
MKKLVILAGFLMLAACKEKKAKQSNWVEINPEIVRLDSVRELWVIRHDSFVDIAIRNGDEITGYDEVNNFFGLNTNDIKSILSVLENKNSVNINQLKKALNERLEWDRAVYEINLENIKN